jgi:hypothetical protein
MTGALAPFSYVVYTTDPRTRLSLLALATLGDMTVKVSIYSAMLGV